MRPRAARDRQSLVQIGSVDGDEDGMLFPAGGPTARKVIDSDKPKKTIRRRGRAAGDGDEDGGPTEAELEERARQLVRRSFDLGHRATRVLLELLDLRLGVDVDAPAGQL